MTRCGRIALAGAPNAGKSTLLNALVGSHIAIVSPRPQATRLPVVGLLTEGDTQFIFVDLPGLLEPAYLMQARMMAAAQEALASADLILHLHSAPDAPAPSFARAARLESLPRAPVLLVYTKADLVGAAARARLEQAAVVVSAREPESLRQLLARIRPLVPEGDFAFDPDDVGTQPLRFFVTEYLREAAFELLLDELPYGFAAEVEEYRESESPVYIRVTLFVERESQKGMVVGRGGRTIKAIGEHARRRLEALLGAQVYLDLWVKVLPKWRRNAHALTRFGFPIAESESS
ncbi:MAG TPA: GTPase Era [Gemmatimonadales bacterium]|jgi:GTP-binding protein Era|nr:GTPase Era [Gemmatimonadales bacterium]